jgi:hypothetical protein
MMKACVLASLVGAVAAGANPTPPTWDSALTTGVRETSDGSRHYINASFTGMSTVRTAQYMLQTTSAPKNPLAISYSLCFPYAAASGPNDTINCELSASNIQCKPASFFSACLPYQLGVLYQKPVGRFYVDTEACPTIPAANCTSWFYAEQTCSIPIPRETSSSSVDVYTLDELPVSVATRIGYDGSGEQGCVSKAGPKYAITTFDTSAKLDPATVCAVLAAEGGPQESVQACKASLPPN